MRKKTIKKKTKIKKKVGPKEDFTPKQVITALKANGGFITYAADKLGCSFQTIYNYMERYPEIKEAMVHIKESVKDLGEGMLLKAVKSGDVTAIKYLLSSKARDRGYGGDATIQNNVLVTGNQIDISKLKENEVDALITKLLQKTKQIGDGVIDIEPVEE